MRPLLYVTLLLLASCHRDAGPALRTVSEPAVRGCEDYQAVMTRDGILYNNVWNKYAAGDREWSQCLLTREVDGVTQYGWRWRWPVEERAVYGYPQIKRGKSPWDPATSMDERFPARIASVRSLNVAYDVETSGDGDYNLSTSLWLTREPVRGDQPNRDAIVAEVMIWTYATPGFFQPAGRKRGEVHAGDTRWEVWADENWGDVSGINDNHWVYLSYHAVQPGLKAEFDVRQLLQYAVDEGLISSEYYIADVMLGNEVMGGTGETWVKSFSVDMN